MNHSESISKIAAALVKAQGEIEAVAKDGTNPHFRSKYATLQNIADTIRPTLRKHGLAVVQTFAQTDGTYIELDTTLIHESGEWISGRITMRPGKADPQGVGSAATYARRYALSAILGIVTDDDDDGNIASQPQGDRTAEAKSKPTAAKSAAKLPALGAADKHGKLTEMGYKVAQALFEKKGTWDAVRRKYEVSDADVACVEAAMKEMGPIDTLIAGGE